ncbi:MAG TPA: hypothetical protein VIM10_07315 [Actinopolymorphaceae bacterium]
MRATVADQVLGGGPLGVQRVGGHHYPGQVELGQQRRELGNLVGLGSDLALGQYHPGAVTDR